MSIQTKHFLNSAETLVVDSLAGLCAVNPALALDRQNKIVHIASHDRNKVSLLCGGGSGHEPAHAGFVGAVCGSVFASPNASQVRRGIDLVENEKGNYTGDVLNFGLAKEQYAALHPDKANRVKFIIVGDDVAVTRSQGKIVGRRGLAGTILVYKLAGALAQRGADLDAVYDVATWAAANVATIGVGLDHCHVPGTAAVESHLSANEAEIGMGIHNETGAMRVSPVPSLSELIPKLIDLLTSTTDKERSFVPFKGKDNVVLLVNNLGGLSELELAGVVGATRSELDKRGFVLRRVLSGTFMTSLNMPGFSLTLLLLPGPNDQGPSADTVLELLDAPTSAPGWKWASATQPTPLKTSDAEAAPLPSLGKDKLSAPDAAAFVVNVKKACKAIIAAEPEITQMDNIAGDGDCGLTLKAGAEGVLKKVQEGTITGDNVVQSTIAIAQVAEEAMGGTSGALYSIFFSGLAQGLNQARSGPQATPETWTKALTYALDKLYSYTRARPPSRTLVDPLAAFITPLASSTDFVSAVKAASAAAEGTRDIEAKAGRSAYVEGDRLKKERVADPGAWGVKTILETLFA
ncbi:dihydroxyacetone kinase [Fistulina hepatica ATCC 64428]|uniref:Dihydroxyacetone kinase n=1 Tax=Fistulina hepatica ATCC 64428 TaxID=1128425 RepID=A0A0D7AJ87_9AGAR|nr:dihydroxyacetone kinase [Fistulina hepatica ATCC 64428]